MSLRSLFPIGQDRSVARRHATDPFTALQTEIERLFDDFSRGWPAMTPTTRQLVPSMDVTESDKEFEITIELPGLEEKDKNYHRYERSYGSFSRSLQLPEGVDPDAIKADLANGVLRVTVPKPAPAQVKKVEVKSAA